VAQAAVAQAAPHRATAPTDRCPAHFPLIHDNEKRATARATYGLFFCLAWHFAPPWSVCPASELWAGRLGPAIAALRSVLAAVNVMGPGDNQSTLIFA